MQMLKRVVFLLALAVLLFSPVAKRRGSQRRPVSVTAYKPNDPSKVVVKVSLRKQNVYVMEGDRA